MFCKTQCTCVTESVHICYHFQIQHNSKFFLRTILYLSTKGFSFCIKVLNIKDRHQKLGALFYEKFLDTRFNYLNLKSNFTPTY